MIWPRARTESFQSEQTRPAKAPQAGACLYCGSRISVMIAPLTRQIVCVWLHTSVVTQVLAGCRLSGSRNRPPAAHHQIAARPHLSLIPRSCVRGKKSAALGAPRNYPPDGCIDDIAPMQKNLQRGVDLTTLAGILSVTPWVKRCRRTSPASQRPTYLER